MRKDIDMAIVEKLYTKGRLSANTIGKALGVTGQTILRRLHDSAIPINKQATAGKMNSHWKGGEALDGCGYMRVLKPGHPKANSHGYVLRCIDNWEKVNGPWPTGKEPHHKDHNILNDSPENIEPLTHSEHARLRTC